MSSRLSIITGIHNALPMNRLFWESLSLNTVSPFELIIIDNNSDDGSSDFFHELSKSSNARQRVRYIRNNRNRAYPATQNQGMELAENPILCFLNNDLWFPKAWDREIVQAVESNHHLIVSPSCQEAQKLQKTSDRLKRRWKRSLLFSRFAQTLLKLKEEDRLRFALKGMYGSLGELRSPTPQESPPYIDGINGSAVIFHRELLQLSLGIWNEEIESADWHLYLTMAKRHQEDPTIPLPRILLNTYVHHFGRYTKKKNDPHYEGLSLKPISAFWTPDEIQTLWWGAKTS